MVALLTNSPCISDFKGIKTYFPLPTQTFACLVKNHSTWRLWDPCFSPSDALSSPGTCTHSLMVSPSSVPCQEPDKPFPPGGTHGPGREIHPTGQNAFTWFHPNAWDPGEATSSTCTGENENEMEFGEFTGSFCHVMFCPTSKRRINTGNVETAGTVEGARVKGGQAFKEKGPADVTGNQSYWLISVSQQRTPGVVGEMWNLSICWCLRACALGLPEKDDSCFCLPKLIGLVLLGQLEHCGQESVGKAIVLHRAPNTGESLE